MQLRNSENRASGEAGAVQTGAGPDASGVRTGYFFLRLFGLWFVGLRLAPIELAC
jgi:hypothetical protein